MSNKKIIGICLVCLLSVSAIVSGFMFVRQYNDAKTSQDAFDDLSGLVADVTPEETAAPKSGEENQPQPTDEELAAQEAAVSCEKYGALFEQNQDFIGWISIEGTNVNYPVMQSLDNPNYYLKHNFEKVYSDYGVPYIDEVCALGICNNIVIYGHHMNNGSMFADLCRYAEKAYYDEHKTIKFDTLSSFGEYEIVAVFKFDTNRETFKYNEYVTMNEKEFDTFMEDVHARELYDTGVDAGFGDQLLTLSTCEYSYKNGRFVVVAKRVN